MAFRNLLITAFDPFGGETVNPAWEAVKLLPQRIGSCLVHKLQIPTVFGEAAQAVLTRAEQLAPDVIVCVGQAGGRSAITPERVAINLCDAAIRDNRGSQPQDCRCVDGGPDAYFVTVPVKAMAQAINNAGVAGQVSLSAGSFVCNDTLYRLLHHYHGTAVQVGFIHVPLLPQQAKNGQPSMELGQTVRGLTAAIEVLGG